MWESPERAAAADAVWCEQARRKAWEDRPGAALTEHATLRYGGIKVVRALTVLATRVEPRILRPLQ